MLGKQGAGKGTQCIRLSRHYVVPHISTGDMFRGAVRSRSEAGLQAKKYMDAGDLIPDSVVIGLVDERLAHTDTSNRGFILDGFPRTVAQAEALDSLLAPRQLDVVIDLQVETEIVLKRLASRRVCTDCGANYSAKQPPRVDGVCDVCGGEVVQREDDTESAIRRRLELYERETAPLIAWYTAKGILAPINGLGQPDEVAARLVRVVEESRQRSLIEAARHPSASSGPSASAGVPRPAAGVALSGGSAPSSSASVMAAGAADATGASGAMGPPGSPGSPGSSGSPGASGSPGRSGSSGSAGSPGSSGSPGVSGALGSSGSPGRSGSSGSRGAAEPSSSRAVPVSRPNSGPAEGPVAGSASAAAGVSST
ncbi:MAG: adenylate kinase [Acidimicrobiaceae bacterium]|nr:adenylate kinase [Acidimicrobiaceae bacterium]